MISRLHAKLCSDPNPVLRSESASLAASHKSADYFTAPHFNSPHFTGKYAVASTSINTSFVGINPLTSTTVDTGGSPGKNCFRTRL